MGQHKIMFALGGNNFNHTFRTGFCPEKIMVTQCNTGLRIEWFRGMAGNSCITHTAATGNMALTTSNAVELVKIDKPITSCNNNDITVVEPGEYWKANGFRLTEGAGVMTIDEICCVEAWGPDMAHIRAVHDGGNNCNTYFQDSSIDFREAGVCGGQQWLLINKSNSNYAYVKAVEKPVGQSRYCRLITSNSGGNNTSAADFDNDDIVFVVPKDDIPYDALTLIGAMT